MSSRCRPLTRVRGVVLVFLAALLGGVEGSLSLQYGEWSACTAACGGGGTQARTPAGFTAYPKRPSPANKAALSHMPLSMLV